MDATLRRTSLDPPGGPVVPLHFRKGTTSLSLFTTIAARGTPQDITLQEFRIESFFALDEPTATVFRSWAAASHTARR